MINYDPKEVLDKVLTKQEKFEKHFGLRRSSKSFPGLVNWMIYINIVGDEINLRTLTKKLKQEGISEEDLRLYVDVAIFVGESFLDMRATNEVLTNYRSELYTRLRRLGF